MRPWVRWYDLCGRLLEAAQLASDFSPPVHDDDAFPVVDRANLQPNEMKALTGFRRWVESGGQYLAPACMASEGVRADSALPLFRLGQLTIYSATKDDINDVDAVLALASQQRRRGRLIDYMVGLQLATRAAEWRRACALLCGAEQESFRPVVGELLRVIAREAVCIVDTLVGTNSTTLLDPPGPVYSDRAAPLFGFVSRSRKIALFKDLHGQVHQQATLVQDDHDKLLAVYQQAEVDRPKSLLLDVTWMFSHTVARALTTMAEYETAVSKQP